MSMLEKLRYYLDIWYQVHKWLDLGWDLPEQKQNRYIDIHWNHNLLMKN